MSTTAATAATTSPFRTFVTSVVAVGRAPTCAGSPSPATTSPTSAPSGLRSHCCCRPGRKLTVDRDFT